MISNIRQILALPSAVVADLWGNHRFKIFSVSIICVYCALHYGLRADIFEEGVCYGQKGSKYIRYDIYFYDFCNKHPLMGKPFLKSEKILTKYFTSFFE